jgi:hypothetical protein
MLYLHLLNIFIVLLKKIKAKTNMQIKNSSVIPEIIICINGCTEIEYLFIACIITLFGTIFIPWCIKCITNIRVEYYDNLEQITIEPLVNELHSPLDLEDDITQLELVDTIEDIEPKKTIQRSESPPTYTEICNNRIQDIIS